MRLLTPRTSMTAGIWNWNGWENPLITYLHEVDGLGLGLEGGLRSLGGSLRLNKENRNNR